MSPALVVEVLHESPTQSCANNMEPLSINQPLATPRKQLDVQGLQRLVCVAQNYAWGRLPQNSEVAQLSAAAGQAVDATKPYAELWMGTHPSAPATLDSSCGAYSGQALLALLRDRPELLGDAVQEFGADLPFLFKVLSVETALSIQSHPDKRLAERLHAERPREYKDDNHKPEMAVALSDFEALCSFVTHEELSSALASVPELQELCGEAATNAYLDSAASSSSSSDSGGEDNVCVTPRSRRQALQSAFTALMTADAALVAAAIRRMCSRLESEAAAGRALSDKEHLVLRLQQQYPDDVGIMAAWFLNHLRLQPGQAIALPANEPHAYISGEIVECMATSDNVIRAGLTPKFRDTAVLCQSLTYCQGAPCVLAGDCAGSLPPGLACYRPPFREFELWRLTPPAGAQHSFAPARGPMIMLVQHGSARVAAAGLPPRDTKRGDVFFVPAGLALQIEAREGLSIWFAACRDMGLQPLQL